MDNQILTEIFKLIGIAVTASMASSGIVMYYVKKHDRVSEIEKKFDKVTEGITLLLENDKVIFEALRKGHINGESEKQEHKMDEYFFRNSAESFKLNHAEK